MFNPKKLVVFLPLSFAFCLQGFAQTGSVSVAIGSPHVNPSPYSVPVVGDDLNIQVSVTSTYQINSVIASLPGGRSVTLTAGTGGYTGTISLVGLPQDTTLLTVTAVDVYNNTGSATSLFIYDHPPTMTIDSPAYFTVAMPNLHVHSRCHSDSGACTISVVLNAAGSSLVTLGTYTDSVDASYDLSAYEGSDGAGSNSDFLELSATDRRGVAVSPPWVPFYVETSPYLTPVFSADKNISDF
ncbi:MAG TPA: hypothetical protein VHE54_08845, partial [Puia sp.]|nr:hypothetical protein [Puia sp.]